MASYFRSFFGGNQSRNTTGNHDSKPHTHSQPAPTVPSANTRSKLSHIYSVPGFATSTSSHVRSVGKSSKHSSRTMAAQTPSTSPTKYESGSARTRGQTPRHYASASSSAPGPVPFVQQAPQLPLHSSSTHNSRDAYQPYQIYAPPAAYGSVRSTTSKARPAPSSSRPTRPVVGRTESSGSVPRSDYRSEPRPVLKTKHNRPTGTRANSRDHVSFLNPHKPTALHMHPLFAYSTLHHAPISYDICYAPTSQVVVDRSTRSPIPSHMLLQPATDPPTYSELTLKCEKLPWPILVAPSSSNDPSASYEFSMMGSKPNLHAGFVTNLDVLNAVHQTLRTRITPTEWEQLGDRSRAQRKTTRAYEKRCVKMEGGWDGGVRRLDYLGGKTRLVGIEIDKSAGVSGGVGKLVFTKA